MRALRIATRRSPLALWQARHVAALLTRLHPGLSVSLHEMTTEGDRFLIAPLSQVGGKGLFVKEIEQVVLEQQADLAVHSLKDMTAQMPEGLCLAVVPEREDPRDAFVSPDGRTLEQLPSGSVVGTSSLRRSCQLLERRPDLRVVSVRGNVQTRLRKMEEEKMAGILLALAGLRRLELVDKVAEVLEPEVSLPAVGQGALAIQCRSDDNGLLQMLAPLDHTPTRIAVTAERGFLSRLEGGCSVPMAGFALVDGSSVRLRALVGTPDGRQVIRGERMGDAASAQAIGEALAQELLDRGAKDILKHFAPQPVPPRS